MRVLWLVLPVTVMLSFAGAAQACVGDGCLNVYATEDGALTTAWDFENRPVPTHFVFCSSGECLYNAIDPGFIHGPAPAPVGHTTVADGTRIRLEVVEREAPVTFRLNGEPLDVGDDGLVGTAPDLHNHPSWQLRLPEDVEGEYSLSFRLTTDSPSYDDSETFTIRLSNLPTPAPSQSPTPSSTPTPGASNCAGDCSGDGIVTVDEIIDVVSTVLGDSDACEAMDFDEDGIVSVSDAVATVHSALYGCDSAPPPATLAFIQDTIFTPRCAIPTCHDSQPGVVDLNLESGSSHDELVGVPPSVDVAAELGYLRVDPGDPQNSFLLVKLEDPPPSFGSPMPLIGDPLSAAEIALIRAWIAAGAEP